MIDRVKFLSSHARKDSEPDLVCTFSARECAERPFRCVAVGFTLGSGLPRVLYRATEVGGRYEPEGTLGIVTPLGSVTVVAPEGGMKRLWGGFDENFVSSK